MNRAVSGHYQPGARENVAYLTSTERRREYEAKAAQEKRDYEVDFFSCVSFIHKFLHLQSSRLQSGLFSLFQKPNIMVVNPEYH